jgi:hypothetical protein
MGTKQDQQRYKSKVRIDAMMAALGTLTFLATLWLLVVIGAMVLEESGARIAAALKGVREIPSVGVVRLRVRARARPQPAIRARAEWRAAA